MMCEWSPPPDPLPLSHGAGEDGFESKCKFKPLCCSFSICPPLSKLEDSSQIDQGSTCSGPLTCSHWTSHWKTPKFTLSTDFWCKTFPLLWFHLNKWPQGREQQSQQESTPALSSHQSEPTLGRSPASKSERKKKVKVVLENGNYDKCQPVHGGQGTWEAVAWISIWQEIIHRIYKSLLNLSSISKYIYKK